MPVHLPSHRDPTLPAGPHHEPTLIPTGATSFLGATLLRLLGGSREPRTRGVETVDGLTRPVTIRRDRWHVPHIDAETDADAWFGLGFCQGQDRAFQLELLRRIGAGRLSEVVGRHGLPIDRLMRRLDLAGRVRGQLDELDRDVRTALAAFAAGVTRGAGPVGSPEGSTELRLLRIEPEPHDAVDVLVTARLMAFLLAANWQTELVRLRVALDDGPAAVRRLEGDGEGIALPVTSPPDARASQPVERLLEDLARLEEWLPAGGASNAWALAPSRTTTGRPILAGDPHLPPTLPPFWYLAHLTTPEWAAAGAALAGAPGIVIGHNGHGAWAVTAGHADDTDLFVEEVDATGTRVREGDHWIDATVRPEHIGVRFGSDETIEVVETPRGPVISPALEGGGPALSIAGMWREAATAAGFLGVPRARTFADLQACFEGWRGMSLNVVWADAGGGIGWQLVGELPERRSGSGSLPLPGWDPAVGWDGHVGLARLPAATDPPSGVLASANNRPVPPAASGPELGHDFLDGYRLGAILDALSDRDRWSPEDMPRIQLDTRSTLWRDLREVLLAVPPAGVPAANTALGLLRAWDGDVTAESAPAAVFELTVAELIVRVTEAVAPASAPWVLGRSPAPDLLGHSLLALRASHVVDLARSRPDDVLPSGWDDTLRACLVHAVHRLEELAGPDPDAWRWGALRPLTLRHHLGAQLGPLGRALNRGPLEMGGDAHTIPQASAPPLEPLANPVAIPSLRMVVDVGAWSAARWALPGGQSGEPTSPHYDDQLGLWARGEGIPIPWTPEEVRDATTATLRLLPASS